VPESAIQLYEPTLAAAIEDAFARLYDQLRAVGPAIDNRVHAWLESMGGGARQQDGYKHPLSYPMLLLPWWTEKAIQDPPDAGFQADLVYSTINGYYAIRMIDNLMDGHATAELDALPALHVFSTEFQRPYQAYFPADHPFWRLFRRTWLHCAEVTLQDAYSKEIGQAHFVEVTARKTEAVKIPIAAVCYRYQQPDAIPLWDEFIDLFGRWHQMVNDLHDWRKDLELGTPTYFLSEARRRSERDEPVIAWVAREGFAWAMETLDTWMGELETKADALRSPDLLGYLRLREEMMLARQQNLAAGLESAARLFGLLRGASAAAPRPRSAADGR
jgi:hypothetical protein